jgi:hypothetical protein
MLFPVFYLIDGKPAICLIDGLSVVYFVDTQPTVYFVDGLSKKIFFPRTLRGSAIATSASIISK